ncbi:phytoene dehydrogenase-like protein [Mycobacterium sp. MAA66]|uniref:phytoene desaturase family protein n=1 Tax=Mycobacterium sp. MAA66 TaxID=3156297 RepID=UPI003516B28F
MTDEVFDIAIIGSGPNGLTAAAYLAKAGARVVVLESRFERGGTFASDDYSTPFTYNLAQLSLPLGTELPPYRDLRLDQHSVGFIAPSIAFTVTAGGQRTTIYRGGRGLGGRAQALLDAAYANVKPLLYQSPSNYDKVLSVLSESSPATVEIAEMTPDTLSSLGESEGGSIALRYAAGLAGFTRNDQQLGVIGAFAVASQFFPNLVVGGTKNLANGIYRVAANAGARGYVSAKVTSVTKTNGVFALVLADRRRIHATTVISTVDPKSNLEILHDDLVSPAYRGAAQDWTVDRTGPFIAHYGIKGQPAADLTPDANAAAQIIGFDSSADVAAYFDSVERGQLPDLPAGHLSPTTLHDPLQASPGPYGPLHTLRFDTMAPLEHPAGSWTRLRTAWRQRIWDTLVGASPELDQAHLLFQFCDSPADIARRFATAANGSIRQGSLCISQTFENRPEPASSTTRTSVSGLYLAGGSVHPGIPGSLGSGYLAAGTVTADLGLNRWWPEPDLTAR